MKKSNISTAKEKSDELAITIQNKYSQLVDEMNGNIESLNDNLINVLLKSTLKVGGKEPKENPKKFQQHKRYDKTTYQNGNKKQYES